MKIKYKNGSSNYFYNINYIIQSENYFVKIIKNFKEYIIYTTEE